MRSAICSNLMPVWLLPWLLQTIQEREMLEKEEEEWAQQEKMRLEQRKVGQYCDFGDLGSRPTLRQEVHKPPAWC